MTEVSREGGRRRWRQESVLQILWEKDRESLSRLSLSEFKLETIQQHRPILRQTGI